MPQPVESGFAEGRPLMYVGKDGPSNDEPGTQQHF